MLLNTKTALARRHLPSQAPLTLWAVSLCSLVLAPVATVNLASSFTSSAVSMGVARVDGPLTTISRYEPTTDRAALAAQGANDGHARLSGVAILDFGRPAQGPGVAMATLDFAGQVAPLYAVVAAAEAYADGYRRAAPPGSSMMVLIGTNDSCGTGQPCGRGFCGCSDEPASFLAWGRAWGDAVAQLNSYLGRTARWYRARAAAGGADDAEPAYDPAFTNTYDLLAGYDEVTGLPMADYGSIDGGPTDGFWTAEQMYLVAYGLRPDMAFPEIYHPGMADQWAALSYWARTSTSAPMTIAGVLSQFPDGYTPEQAYASLLGALSDDYPGTKQSSVRWSSNMTYAGGGPLDGT